MVECRGRPLYKNIKVQQRGRFTGYIEKCMGGIGVVSSREWLLNRTGHILDRFDCMFKIYNYRVHTDFGIKVLRRTFKALKMNHFFQGFSRFFKDVGALN